MLHSIMMATYFSMQCIFMKPIHITNHHLIDQVAYPVAAALLLYNNSGSLNVRAVFLAGFIIFTVIFIRRSDNIVNTIHFRLM